MKGIRLLSVAGHLPAQTVTNADLIARGLDTSDEWIMARVGIASRRAAAPDETVIDLAYSAASKALADAGVPGAEVDLVVLATTTMPEPVPGGAGQLAERIGARGGAFDLNAGCSGGCYALAVAADAIRAGSARTAVVVGAEKLTHWVDPADRNTSIIFGDGAGAFVLTADDDPDRRDVGPVAWGHNGAGHTLIQVPPGGRFIEMEGRSVFRWATTELAPVALEACAKAGVAVEELAAFVPHQANLRIVESLAKAIGIDESRTVISRDIVDTGNTSAASVPLALANLVASGKVASGGQALLIAFGAGLSMAAQVVRCP